MLEQRLYATNFFDLLNSESNFHTFNVEKRLMTAMIDLPQLGVIRIMYGLGIGASRIDKLLPIDGRYLIK